MQPDAGDPVPGSEGATHAARAAAGPVDAEFLAGIVDAAFHPYVVLSRDGTILYASPTVVTLLGRPAGHYVGRSIVEVLDPSVLDRSLRAFAEFTDPDRQSTGWIGPPMTIALRHADGHLVPCRALAVPGAPGFDGLVLQIRATETTTKLDEAIASLAQGDPADTTITRIIEFATEQMPYSILVIGRGFDGERFESVVAHPRAPRFDDDALPILDGTPWMRALAADGLVVVDSDDVDPPVGPAATAAGLPTAWAVPISSANDQQHVLVFWRRARGGPAAHLREAIERIRRLITLAIDADHSRRLLERQASTDGLTGLANRVALFERLAELGRARAEQRFGVLYVDLDDFKVVNDECGHRTGDQVLKIAARRLVRQVRGNDLVARLGGDEFAVIGAVSSGDELESLAQRLVESFAEPVVVDGQSFQLGVSVGLAVGRGGVDPELVLDDADRAMLRAKAAGKHRWARAEPRG
jgi:diguanylate cyclase (GGDEF)-like protein